MNRPEKGLTTDFLVVQGLTSLTAVLKYAQFRPRPRMYELPFPRSPIPETRSPMTLECKHPRVKVVAREEDSEFVECLECGDVFEASEFKDMDIEEQVGDEDES